MIILSLLAVFIFIWALTREIPCVNSEVNPTDNSEVNPTDNSEVNSEINSEVNPTDNSEVNPTEKSNFNGIYEMDPLDAPPIQYIDEDFEIVEPDSDESIGMPKHLRSNSYEENKSTLASIFDNVKPKSD